MLGGLGRFLLRNIGLKFTALMLALAFYLHVFATQVQEATIDIPLRIVDVPAGMTITGEIPQNVEVLVRGAGKELLKLRARNLRTQISVARAGEGRFQRPIVADDIALPSDIEAQAVEVLAPRVLNLVFDRLMEKRVPVFPTVTGAPASGFLVSGPIRSDPDSVMLHGPQRLLEPFEFCRTLDVGIQGATGPLRAVVEVMTPAGVRAEPPEVLVVVPIERLVVRNIDGLPVEVLKSGSIRNVEVDPSTGSVEILGPESIVARLRPGDLELRIDARNLRPGTHMLMVSVVLNREVEDVVSVEPSYPEKFRVTLE
ncbi:MAG: hypothetical protein GF355_15230 [Candidatus Eisenbacteria bacterium]|nr:hypothetical protein [Candidatus Eisenbacteria bacterium]